MSNRNSVLISAAIIIAALIVCVGLFFVMTVISEKPNNFFVNVNGQPVSNFTVENGTIYIWLNQTYPAVNVTCNCNCSYNGSCPYGYGISYIVKNWCVQGYNYLGQSLGTGWDAASGTITEFLSIVNASGCFAVPGTTVTFTVNNGGWSDSGPNHTWTVPDVASPTAYPGAGAPAVYYVINYSYSITIGNPSVTISGTGSDNNGIGTESPVGPQWLTGCFQTATNQLTYNTPPPT